MRLIWKTRNQWGESNVVRMVVRPTNEGSSLRFWSRKSETFAKVGKKCAATIRHIRLRKRFERLFHEKSFLVFQDLAKKFTSGGKTKPYDWSSGRRKKRFFVKVATVNWVTFNSSFCGNSSPDFTDKCWSCSLGLKNNFDSWWKMAYLSLTGFTPLLNLACRGFRNSRFPFFSSFSLFIASFRLIFVFKCFAGTKNSLRAGTLQRTCLSSAISSSNENEVRENEPTRWVTAVFSQ